TKNQMLPVLNDPAVLTSIHYPSNALTLVQTLTGGKRTHQLLAQSEGNYEIDLQYQLHVVERNAATGFDLPTQQGMVNRITLTLTNLDVDVSATSAVSAERQ